MVYLDASFVVALIVNEPASAQASQWLARHPRSRLCTADWCVTEVASALSFKVRTAQLSDALAQGAWSAFQEACDGLFQLHPVTSEDFAAGAQLCLLPESGLRAGDSLHLAVARRLQCRGMLSLDRTLTLNARASGLETFSAA